MVKRCCLLVPWPVIFVFCFWALLAGIAVTPEFGGTRSWKLLSNDQFNARAKDLLGKRARRTAMANAWVLEQERRHQCGKWTPKANASDGDSGSSSAANRAEVGEGEVAENGPNAEVRNQQDSGVLHKGTNPRLPSICIGIEAMRDRVGNPVVESVYSVFRGLGHEEHGRVMGMVQVAEPAEPAPRKQILNSPPRKRTQSHDFETAILKDNLHKRQVGGTDSLACALPGLSVRLCCVYC